MLGNLVSLRKQPTERSVTDLPWVQKWDTDVDMSPTVWAGKTVNLDTAQQLIVVYGASSFHADHLSGMPIHTYEKKKSGARVEVDNEPWLEEPFPGLDITTALAQMWWSYWLGGHILALITRGFAGRITAMLPIHPDHFQFIIDGKGQVALMINGQRYGGEYLSIPHVIAPGCWRGVNPIEAARQTIGMGLAATEFGARFFGTGQQASGVLSLPGEAPTPDDMKLLKAEWVSSYGGSARSHLPAILFGGADWKPISITNEQAQFLETRRFTDAQIAGNLFHLPGNVLNIAVESGATINYQNVAMAWSELVRRWLPHLRRMKRGLSALMVGPKYIEFNADAYLQADLRQRYEAYGIGIDNGFLVPNEARETEDLPPLTGGDVVRPMRPSPLAPPPASN